MRDCEAWTVNEKTQERNLFFSILIFALLPISPRCEDTWQGYLPINDGEEIRPLINQYANLWLFKDKEKVMPSWFTVSSLWFIVLIYHTSHFFYPLFSSFDLGSDKWFMHYTTVYAGKKYAVCGGAAGLIQMLR